MKCPDREPSKTGLKAWKAWLADLRDFVYTIQPLRSENIELLETPMGTQIRAILPRPGAGGGSATKDFALYDASDVHGLKVGIKFGNVTPSIALDSGVNVWPEEFSGTSTPPWTYTFAVSASGLAYLIVTVDPGDDTTAPKVTSISFGHGTELPDFTDDTGYFTLGNWSVTGSGASAKVTILNSEGIGSQSYGYCGGAHYFDPA